MLVNVGSLPRIADPNVCYGPRSDIPLLFDHVRWQMTFLLLVLVVQHEYRELGCLCSSLLLPGSFDIFLQLLHSVFERGPSVVNLVNDKNILSDQVAHLK